MKIITNQLWSNTPGMCEEIPQITAYIPDNKQSDAAIIIFPGGGYAGRAAHEGEAYAKFLAKNGYTAFVCDYRVSPHRFPFPLLDARRAVRTVRSQAAEYGIDKNKIAVMGSSAGGHLAAFISTYDKAIDFEGIDDIDNEEFVPNAQILCYPVIKLYKDTDTHMGSAQNLLGDRYEELCHACSPDLIANEKTPQAFIWHTFEDGGVPIGNSLDYAKALKKNNIPVEMHIYPHGSHGLGLALNEDEISKHVSAWSGSLLKWLSYIGF